MNKRGKVHLLILFLLLFSAFILILPANAARMYVSPGGNDANTGLSWADAVQTIQRGLSNTGPGGEVWVAAGTYEERFILPMGCSVYGGFTGTETSLDQRNWRANVTVIDGNPTEDIVINAANGTIDGFKISHLGASGSTGTGIETNPDSTLTVRNCEFEGFDQSAIYHGGGGHLNIYNCKFEECANAVREEYVFVPMGPSSPGSVYVVGSIFYRCDNAFLFEDTLDATFISCTFSACGNAVAGDFEYTLSFSNCVLAGRDVVTGQVNTSYDKIVLMPSVYCYIDYSVLGNGTSTMISDMMGGVLNYGDGNVEGDPMLSSTFAPQPGSPCIDAGSDDNTEPGLPDIMGNPRIIGDHVDIGAVESLTDDPPVAQDGSLAIMQDTVGNGTLVATDPNGNPITFSLMDNSQHGETLVEPSGSYTYTPDSGFFGTDLFTFKASDGVLDSNTATININVFHLNHPPIADDQQVFALMNLPTSITLTGSDPDGDPLNYSLADPIQNGSLTGTPPNLTYTPDTDYTGQDGFTFQVDDGVLVSNLATVSIDVALRMADNVISVSSDEILGEGPSTSPSINSDGRYVVFYSQSANLVPNDTNNQWDCFLRDRQLGTTELISISTAGDQGNNQSNNASGCGTSQVSDDGRFVVFESFATNLTSDPSIGVCNIYLRDRQEGTTIMVSCGYGGNPSYSGSYTPSIDPSGRYIVFWSDSPNLTDNDNNYMFDIFRYDRISGELICASRRTDGVYSNNWNDYCPAVDINGNVFFTSAASNLAPNYTGLTQIQRRDSYTGQFTVVSLGPGGVQCDGQCYYPTIDAQGTKVAWMSDSPNMVGNDSNGSTDIFIRDLVNNITTCASVNPMNYTANGASSKPRMSASGNAVAFMSNADNLVDGVPSGRTECYVRDTMMNRTYLVSKAPDGTLGDGYDGDIVVVNGDGTVAAFMSTSTNFAVSDTNNSPDVFVYVRQPNVAPVAEDGILTVMEDVSGNGTLVATDANNDPLYYMIVDAPQHGSAVVDPTGSYTYTPSAGYFGPDSFTFKATDGLLESNIATISITVNHVNHAPVANDAQMTVPINTTVPLTLSVSDPDGDVLNYTVIQGPQNGTLSGTAPNLTYTPNMDYIGDDSIVYKVNDGQLDSNQATVSIKVAARMADNVISVSSEELLGNAMSTGPSISADGRFTVFFSNATNLVPNDTNGTWDVFLRDTLTGATERISVSTAGDQAEGGTSGNPNVYGLLGVNQISGDGRYVVFESAATNLAASPTNGFSNIYLRDRQEGTTQLINTTFDGMPQDGASIMPSVDRDGRWVVFFSHAGNLVAGDNNSNPDIFRYDIATGELICITRSTDGTFGMGTLEMQSVVDIYGNVYFSSMGENLLPQTNGKMHIIKRDASAGDFSCLTLTPGGTLSEGWSYGASVTADGTKVAWYSSAEDLDNIDTNSYIDVYVRDMVSGVTRCESVNTFGMPAEWGGYNPQISGDGRYLVFFSSSTDLVPGDTSPQMDYYVRNLSGRVTQVASLAPDGSSGNAFSGETIAISYDGSCVAFQSCSSNFAENDDNSTFDIFKRQIHGENQAPVAQDGALIMDMETTAYGNLVATDADNDGVTFIIIDQPVNGTLELGEDGAYTYTPTGTFYGADSFTFKATDGMAESNVATISITVNHVNHPPVAADGSFTTDEDVPVSGTLIAADSDGDPMRFQVVDSPVNGSISVNAVTGAFTYTPNTDYNGGDVFTFKVLDPSSQSNIATVTITVNSINDIPTANNQAINCEKNTSFTGAVTGSDPEGDLIYFEVVTQPTNGTLTAFDKYGPFTYKPSRDFIGTDSFSFIAKDASGNSVPATVAISVVNFVPTCEIVSVDSDEIIGNKGSFLGRFTRNNNSVVFESNANSLDPDDINSYRDVFMRDMALGETSIVSLTDTEASGNQYSAYSCPDTSGRYVLFSSVASNMIADDRNNYQDVFMRDRQLGTTERIVMGLSGAEPNGASLPCDITPDMKYLLFYSTASNLVANDLNGYADIYVLEMGTTNIDRVNMNTHNTVQANGNTLNSAAISADGRYAMFMSYASNLVINDTNNAPDVFLRDRPNQITTRVNLTSSGGQANSGSVYADMSADAKYIVFQSAATNIVTGVDNGYAQIYLRNQQTGSVKCISMGIDGEEANYNCYTCRISDDGSQVIFDSAAGNLTANSTYGTWQVYRFDVNTGRLTLVSCKAGVPGNQSSTAVEVSNDGHMLINSRATNLADGDTNNDTDVFCIDYYGAINTAPVAEDGVLTTDEDTDGHGSLIASDPEGQTLTYRIVTQGAKGTVTISNPTKSEYTYTPNPDENGTDTFTFVVNDGYEDSNVATITVTINAMPEKPVAQDGTLTVTEDVPEYGALQATDEENDPLTFAIVTNGTLGTAYINDPATGDFLYKPLPNKNGTDTFTFTATDVEGTSNVATITVTILPANDAPAALNGPLTAYKNSITNGRLLGSDPDGDAVTYQIVSQGTKGIVTITDPSTGAYYYTANLYETGSDTFTFLVNDGTVDSNTATITVNILPQGPDVDIISVDSNEVLGNSNSMYPSVSADGRYVVFASTAYNLVPGDNNNMSDIFLRDRTLGTTICISRSNSTGAVGNGVSNTPVISADGNVIVFQSYATNLVGTDPYTNADIFVYFRSTGQLTLASRSYAGSWPNGSSSMPKVSGDGSYITYVSNASNIANPDANGTMLDVFVVNTHTWQTSVGSLSDGEVQGDASSNYPSISSNGRYLAFSSDAKNLVLGDNNLRTDVFVRDITGGNTKRVSVKTGNIEANGSSMYPMISPDGRYIVFTSQASNLVGNDYNNQPDAFMHDYQTGITTRVSVSATGAEGDLGSMLGQPVAVTSNARLVAFSSASTNLIPDDTNGQPDVFITDMKGMVRRMSESPTREGGTGASSNVALDDSGSLRCFFQSMAKNLAIGDTNGYTDIFVYEAYAYNKIPVAQDVSIQCAEDDSADEMMSATDADGDKVIYTIVSQPANGKATMMDSLNGMFNYKPNPNFFGDDSFTYRVTDGKDLSNNATVNVFVSPINDSPVPQNDSVVTDEDTPITIDVLANDTDVEGDTLMVTAVSLPSDGEAVINADNTVTYTPDHDFNGTDSFTYTVKDVHDSKTATVNVTINSVNDAPVLRPVGWYTVNEEELLTFRVNAVNGDDDTVTYLAEDMPEGASLDPVTGDFSWTPTRQQAGTYHVTIIATDGELQDSDMATIEVLNLNVAPVAVDDTASTDEDTAVNIAVLANDTDDDGDPLTVETVSNPENGTAEIESDSSITYTPDENYAGIDTFTYTLSDGTDTVTATVTITVNPVNDPPVAENDTAVTDEDTSVLVNALANDTDADNDTLSILMVDDPANGTAVLNMDISVTYTPDENFSGVDSFTYTVIDGKGGSAVGTVTVTINPVSDPPVIVSPGDQIGREGSLLAFAVSATDGDGDTLAYSGSNLPTGASVDPATGEFNWTPGYDQAGDYAVTITVTDGVYSDSCTINISIEDYNRPPTLDPIDDLIVNEGDTVNITATAHDPDGAAMTMSVKNLPTGATFSFVDNGNGEVTGTFTWPVEYDQADVYYLTFSVKDGDIVVSDPVRITVNDKNRAPIAVDDTAEADEDSAVNISVTKNDYDPDGDTFKVVSFTTPSHGLTKLDRTGTMITYTPNPDYNGPDSFTYTIKDSQSNEATASVYVTVLGVNDPPVAENDTAVTDEDTSVVVNALANDTDAENDTLSILMVDDPAHGTAILNESTSITYTPDENFSGVDSFTYTVIDGQGGSAVGTVTVTVNSVNDPPVFNDLPTQYVNEGETLTFIVTANDPDGDPLTYTVTGLPTGASFDPATGVFTWTPDYNSQGIYSKLNFTVNDGLAKDYMNVIIEIANVNQPPVAQNSSIITDEDTPGNGTLYATDADGDTLTFSIVTQPAHGDVALESSGAYTYTPDANYEGSDLFTFKANDGTDDSGAGTVNITVRAVNDAPVLSPIGSKTGAEGELLAFNISATDAESDPINYSAVGLPAGANIDSETGDFTWAPNYDQAGTYTVTFTADDGELSDTETITITITDINRPPTLDPIADLVIDEGDEVNITAAAHDPDGDALTMMVKDSPAGSSFSYMDNGGGEVTGTFTWPVEYDQAGVYYLTFSVWDGDIVVSDPVRITVYDKNRAPIPVDDEAEIEEDNYVNISVGKNDSDPDGDTFKVVSVTQPSHGSAVLIPTGTMVTYTPDPDYNGPDSFTYTIDDLHGNTATGNVYITVLPVNDAPVLAPVGNRTVDENNLLTFTVSASDVENDSLTCSSPDLPAGASLDPSTGAFTWTPGYDQAGVFSVTIIVSDGSLTDSEVISITVNNVNRSPMLDPIGDRTGTEGEALAFAVTASDPDGTVVALTTSALPTGASFDQATGAFSWTPDYDQAGTYTVTFTAGDGELTDTETVTITISDLNRAPLAVDDTVVADEDSSVVAAVLDNDSDPDNDTLSVTGITQPANGSAVLNADGTVTYTPNEDYYGPDSFTYTISDGELSATASVSITVNSVNDLPTAAFVFSPTAPTTLDTVSFTDGSSDPDGTIVSWAWDFGDGKVSSDQHPAHMFLVAGVYNVTLTVTDNEGGSDSYSSTVVVTPGYNTMPGDNIAVDLGSGVTITFTQVLGGGDTELVTSSTPPHGPPDGFKFLGTYYDIVTEATYAGPITITFPYDPAEIPEGRLDHLKVFHADGSGGWQDVTISVDTVNHVIVAQVNSLSWFAIGYLEQKYEWVEFLPPITNTNKSFKRGSTIPIKFRITDMNGNPAPNATAALTVYYLVSGAPEGEPEVISTAAGDLGNLFRYSPGEDLYIFNLSTKDSSYLNYFTYRAVVNLEDGTVQSIDFSLKN